MYNIIIIFIYECKHECIYACMNVYFFIIIITEDDSSSFVGCRLILQGIRFIPSDDMSLYLDEIIEARIKFPEFVIGTIATTTIIFTTTTTTAVINITTITTANTIATTTNTTAIIITTRSTTTTYYY